MRIIKPQIKIKMSQFYYDQPIHVNPAIVAYKHPASELVNVDQTYKQLGPIHRPIHPFARQLGQPEGLRNPCESPTSHLSTMHHHLVNGISCDPLTQYYDRNLDRCVNIPKTHQGGKQQF